MKRVEIDQQVRAYYNENRPVMGAPDDTDDAHAAALRGARLRVLREIVERHRQLRVSLIEVDVVNDVLNAAMDVG